MKLEKGDNARLKHILDAIKDIETFTKGITYQEYNSNYMMRLALVKLFEIIGEASARMSDPLKNKFNEIEWQILKAVRNILIHEYFGIDYQTIWDSIQKDIPVLKIKIEEIINRSN